MKKVTTSASVTGLRLTFCNHIVIILTSTTTKVFSHKLWTRKLLNMAISCGKWENLYTIPNRLHCRGGYRIRQVRQLTYFSFNRHKCVYKMLQISIHWEIVIMNIEESIIPRSKFKVVSQLNTHPRKLVRT